MKKGLISIMAIAMVFTLTACGNNNTSTTTNDNNNNATETKKSSINLDNVKSKIEELGVNVEETEVYYQMVGATNGMKLVSGDYRIEVYKFDKSSDSYKAAEKNQKLSISEDYSFDAVVKNGYAYIIDAEFPQHDNVVKLLDQLK